ncbi:hypothetical protein BN1708_017399 [Verticillium longisporum]|uniref:Uncharacterized protein n=1 Tax=Verticillium longisporum TaxID=100787 RepID=A0A0G4L195_VERLO|nr:hypothetical protein BN1708_017399 [Verticillium longisporum]
MLPNESLSLGVCGVNLQTEDPDTQVTHGEMLQTQEFVLLEILQAHEIELLKPQREDIRLGLRIGWVEDPSGTEVRENMLEMDEKSACVISNDGEDFLRQLLKDNRIVQESRPLRRYVNRRHGCVDI